MPVAFAGQFAVGAAHQFSAESDLQYLIEAQRPDGAHDPPWLDRVESCWEGRGQGGENWALALQKGSHVADGASDLLGSLSTDLDTATATDAALFDYLRLASLNLDGIGRTVTHAVVAPLALLFDRSDDPGHIDPLWQ